MNKVQDKSNDRAYFILTPRIVLDLADDPYQVMAWNVVKDIAGEKGECYLSTEDLAILAKMSVGKFSQCRQALLEKGLLEGEVRRDPGYPQPVWHLRVPDLWARNIRHVEANPMLRERIAKARSESLHEVKPSPGEEGPSPGEAKKNQKKNHLPPVGGGVVLHDLDEVAFIFEGAGHRKDDLRAQCPHCQAGHDQSMNVCPDCGAHVVWENSRVWKRLYGDPKKYLRTLQGEDLKATGPLEIDFCQRFNHRAEFANVAQQKQFRALARKHPAGYLQELMAWAEGKGFQALKGAADNPDNLTKWKRKQYEETQPGDNSQPSGWELLALQAQEG